MVICHLLNVINPLHGFILTVNASKIEKIFLVRIYYSSFIDSNQLQNFSDLDPTPLEILEKFNRISKASNIASFTEIRDSLQRWRDLLT